MEDETSKILLDPDGSSGVWLADYETFEEKLQGIADRKAGKVKHMTNWESWMVTQLCRSPGGYTRAKFEVAKRERSLQKQLALERAAAPVADGD